MITAQIWRAFAFNNITSKELRVVRILIPMFITIAVFIIYLVLPKKPEIMGDKKYLDYLLQIIGILPGFYIAALAAGATFTNSSLDEIMPGKNPPTLKTKIMGQELEPPLTIRIFICHLFSYLSATALVLAFAILAAIEINPSLEYIKCQNKSNDYILIAITLVQYLAVLAITFYVVKIASITLHGLYFLAERMHMSNQ